MLLSQNKGVLKGHFLVSSGDKLWSKPPDDVQIDVLIWMGHDYTSVT